MKAPVDEILIESDATEYRAVAVADGQPVDMTREPVDRRLVPGSVHLARVARIAPQVGAFLDLADGLKALLDVAGARVPAQGDMMRVQVVEAPSGDKLARAATRVTLAGRHVTLAPGGKGASISKRTAAPKREALQALAGRLHRENEGLTLRAGAAYAEPAAVESELERLRVQAADLAAGGDAPRLLLADDPFATIVRTLAPQDAPDIYCDRAETALAARLGLKTLFPDLSARVAHLRDGGAIFERHGVADILVTLGSARVNLDSGAWLSIEPTAALVAIDVNLGRATAEPVTVDIAAAREIARQVRLRDLGGLVVVDFLRLSKPGERARLVEALKRATVSDRKRVDVLGYTAGGTIEFTRARSRGGSLD
ncbi:MAG: ribonuclease E/G [Rhodospirillales bacterium]|nr:ribonuclease E/G [Rhodospirillales bacterium]